ncbi:MAG: GYDIA family GHMP kinase [Bacteroidota bacterium]
MNGVHEFRANGKLLLTGEYLVLMGATALALPTRFGQKMAVEPSAKGTLCWESFSPGGRWFTATFDTLTFGIQSADNIATAAKLSKLLAAARALNPAFLAGDEGCMVKTDADYPLAWGLGSSSTLCYLIASWAAIDPFKLHAMVSNGSGYDLACAGRSDLLFYRLKDGLPEITTVTPGNALKHHTWFAYLGNKQDTDREVSAFLSAPGQSIKQVELLSQLATGFCVAETAGELISLATHHESVMAAILKREPVARRFPSFPGTVKSLGAWGGDFAMFISGHDPQEVTGYLQQQGLSVVFSYMDIKAVS